MRVLVVNSFIREAVGDAALLSVMLQQVEAAFPGSDVVVSSLEPPTERPDFEGRRNIGSSRRYGADETVHRATRAARKMLMCVVGLLWFRGPAVLYQWLTPLLPSEARAEVRAVEEADLVVSVGGGYLNGKPSLSGDLSVAGNLVPLMLAGRLGTPSIWGPGSFGPFGTDRQRSLARTTINRASLVLVREDTSLSLLQDIGVRPSLLRRAVDSAFALPQADDDSDWRSRLGLAPTEFVVGMTARQWLDPDAQATYESSLAGLVDHIQGDLQGRVVLIPQVISTLAGEDDREVNRRIADRCSGPPPVLVEDVHDHTSIKDLYSCLDLVVGMRFHSVIFALSSCVPAMAIDYHHKSSGIMAELDLAEWVIKLDEVDVPTLVATFDRLVEQRGQYVAHLEALMPGYIDRARGTTGVIEQAFQAHCVRAS